jgi:integrase/recombinase XerD
VAEKGRRIPLSVIGPADDPGSLYHQMHAFLTWMRERNYSERTAESREVYLRMFILWCDERGITRPQEVTRPIIERYQRYLFLYRKKDGEPLSNRSQHTRLTPIRAWFRWLTKSNRLLYNPAADIDMPRMERRLPKHVLTTGEAEQVLNTPDLQTDAGVRDRAILETLYSTGMRRMELVGIKLFDVDLERGTLMIRLGKGKKDRMVPIGDRALAWIARYRDEVRPQWALAQDDGILFLTMQGEALSLNRLTQMVREYIEAAQIGKQGSCHLFRHTMATLMLENGADIRFIQAMLGHADISTTQIYTQVSIRQLKDIHTATHPARLTRQGQVADATIRDEGQQADAASLLAELDAEAADEEHDG